MVHSWFSIGKSSFPTGHKLVYNTVSIANTRNTGCWSVPLPHELFEPQPGGNANTAAFAEIGLYGLLIMFKEAERRFFLSKHCVNITKITSLNQRYLSVFSYYFVVFFNDFLRMLFWSKNRPFEWCVYREQPANPITHPFN